MHFLIVAQEFPYPANHGGRADVWRRVLALKKLGAAVSLVCWFDDSSAKKPTPDDIESVNKVVENLYLFPIKKKPIDFIRRFISVIKGQSSHTASRILRGNDKLNLLDSLKNVNFNLVFLDSLYGAHTALSLAKQFKKPIIYRSHNIEHKYFKGQAKSAISIKNKLAWNMACINLKSMEKKVLSACVHYFDISIDDMNFWGGLGFTHGSWLPPLPEAALHDECIEADLAPAKNSIGFLGNLNTPNNVMAVEWLVGVVMPLVLKKKPDAILNIAGSNPSHRVLTLCSSNDRVNLHSNIPNATAFMSQQYVLVNPALSGSGVNVKTLDMLMTNRPVVSTLQGVCGLSTEVKSLCLVAETPERFSEYIIACLDDMETTNLANRCIHRAAFSVDIIQKLMLSTSKFS